MENQTNAVIQSLIKGFNATDRKDFALQRSLWADELTIDFGGVKPAQKVKADDLIAWAKIAYKNMTTMHMSFNHEVQIDGDRATVYSYGRALHKQQLSEGEDFWFIYNRYEHELIHDNGVWKVTRLQMTPVFEEGNPDLVNQAYEETVQ
ncbi:nuclear transport factor 2 family protein [Chitinophaga agrisoli]|uniref:Nuclear transport factor 2 family protein n=1 Tax=Chitinophaga agrisoli TaxID=2607653 RepID=A0A5B2VL42_9BACT|nr:nuclear transport factor 2 family protein [Chitinophaga agrisoli]KAA2239534.1 nuclear transport factor 2 family protein [Chitinophaga agrisoli]